MHKAELLAPAGNMDCLKAAVNNGADAVYLGGKNFSARAFAGNFDEEELREAIRYAHLRGVKIYVTLNTLLNEKEIANAIKTADFYYQNNVDALLIQDYGLYYALKNRYPDFELHCSTQMHIHNIEGIRTAKKLGFKRVVVARESQLSFIEEACKQGIEIETFVHGAICVSYSGQCLMSSVSKNRSANRGMCAQCCRLRYELYGDDQKRISTDTDYLLSPKDMFLLEDIPLLIKAGVSSFKIEGRMKSSAYVGYVTSVYRKAIDAYYEGREFHSDTDMMNKLKVLFNRSFTNDLLYGRKDLFGQKTPNHLGIRIGKTVSFDHGMLYMKLDEPLSQYDGIRINDFGCIVNMLYKDGLLVNKADKGDVVAIKAEKKLDGPVYKTLDHELEKTVNSVPDKKMPLDLHIVIKPDQKVTVSLKTSEQSFTDQSPISAQKALKAPLSKDSITKQFSRLNGTAYYLEHLETDTKDAFLKISDLNEIRRQAIEAFDDYRLSSFSRKIIAADIDYIEPEDETVSPEMIQKKNQIMLGDEIYPINYVINPYSRYVQSDNAVISEAGGLLKQYPHKIAYYTLNCSNSYAYEFFKKLGFKHIVLSTELKQYDIFDLIEAYKSRNHKEIHPYVYHSGNRVLMYIGSDPFGRYMNHDDKYMLSDGNNSYSISLNNDITELKETGNSTNPEYDEAFLSFVIEE